MATPLHEDWDQFSKEEHLNLERVQSPLYLFRVSSLNVQQYLHDFLLLFHAHVQDLSGQIQIYVRKDQVGEDQFAIWNSADLGERPAILT
jgi:lysyl-tRNA synthetase class 2